MTKRRFPIYLICFAILIQVFPAWGTESIHLVILHVNDTHGLLLPYDTEEAKDMGGIARMATRIKEIRKENEGRTLVLHAGDIFSRGDLLTVHYGGKINLMAMAEAGYDALTPGNGDFYFGAENLMHQTAQAKFAVLLANVFYKENGKRLFPPYVIKEMAGVKIAILGLGFIRLSHPSGWPLDLKDPVETAREYLPILQDKADIVIALTHIGLNEDKRLAAAVPEIDIIVGGHSHSKVDIPLRIPGGDGKGDVIVVQAGDYGKYLGRLDVHLRSDESGKYNVVGVEGKLLPIDSHVREDEEVANLLERYSDPLSEVICISEIALEHPNEGTSPMGNFVAEVLRAGINADAALLDRGAAQRGITQGEVSIADVCQIHPWWNRVVELTLTGSELQQILVGQDIYTSGISYSNIDGRIEDLKIGRQPAEPDKEYKIAAGEYLLAIIPSLREVPFKNTGERVDTILMKHLQQLAVIRDTTRTDEH